MQKKVNINDTIKAKVVIFMVNVLALPPLFISRSIGALAGWCAWRFNARAAKVARVNIKLCLPNLTEAEAENLVKRSLITTGKTAGEMAKAWIKPLEYNYKQVVSVKDEEIFRQAVNKNMGAIILVPHLGNWEIINAYVSKNYEPIALYRPPRIKGLDKWIRRVRERVGLKLIPATREGVQNLPNLLKEGKNLFILPDQEPSKGHGEFAPFFGVQALTMRLASRLARDFNVPVVCMYGKRLKKGFEVVFKAADPGIHDLDLNTSIAAMNKSVENCVNDIPEQYQWSYKRFKTRPLGEPKLYKFK